MKAFIGLLMCSFLSLPGEEEEGEVEDVDEELVGDIWVMADIAVRLELMPERLCMGPGIWYIDMLWTPENIVCPGSSTVMLL